MIIFSRQSILAIFVASITLSALDCSQAEEEVKLHVDATLNFTNSPLGSIGVSVRIRNDGNKPSVGWQESCPLGLFEIRLHRMDKEPVSEVYSSVVRPVAPPRNANQAGDPFSREDKVKMSSKGSGRDDVQPGEVVQAGAMFSVGASGLRLLKESGLAELEAGTNHIAENGVYEFSVTMLRDKKTVAKFRFEVEGADEEPVVRVISQ